MSTMWASINSHHPPGALQGGSCNHHPMLQVREVRPRGNVTLLGHAQAHAPSSAHTASPPPALRSRSHLVGLTGPTELPGWFWCEHQDASPAEDLLTGSSSTLGDDKTDSESHRTALKSNILSPEFRDSSCVSGEGEGWCKGKFGVGRIHLKWTPEGVP